MPNHDAKRGLVAGWSTGAARRNQQFLQSVDCKRLAGAAEVGYAFTLTVRECPLSPQIWAGVVKRFFDAMIRTHGCIRFHWVIEWQKRQVPHLHGCMFFPEGEALPTSEVVDAWCWFAQHGARATAQTVKPLSGMVGWLRYVAKHASRGVKHYQRSAELIPPAWRGRTGRMWGHRGEWPLGEVQRYSLEGPALFAFRRLVRAWRKADARCERNPDERRKRIVSARRMLKCSHRAASELRGAAEWVSPDLVHLFLSNLLDRGYSIGLLQKIDEPAPPRRRIAQHVPRIAPPPSSASLFG